MINETTINVSNLILNTTVPHRTITDLEVINGFCADIETKMLFLWGLIIFLLLIKYFMEYIIRKNIDKNSIEDTENILVIQRIFGEIVDFFMFTIAVFYFVLLFMKLF